MRLFLAALLFVVLTVVGVVIFDAGSGGGAPVYRTLPIERGDLVSTVTSSGTVNAVVTVEVGSQLSGQVAELFVDFNDAVRKDQLLARLDPRSYEAAEREAEAQVESAWAELLRRQAAVRQAAAELKNTHDDRDVAKAKMDNARALYLEAERYVVRGKKMSGGGTLSKNDYERLQTQEAALGAELAAAKAQLRAKQSVILAAEAAENMAKAEIEAAAAAIKEREAALQKARVDLARMVIRAPIDGVVISRDVDLGQTVAASLQAPTLFTIAQDLRQMQVEASVDEADIGRVKTGQRVAFAVDAYPGRIFEGGVVQIRRTPQVVQNVVTYTVVISAENKDLALLPGMTATVRIVTAEKADLLKVPNAALRFRPRGSAGTATPRPVAADASGGTPGVVWLLDRDGPVAVGVQTGASDDSAHEIVSGDLREGQQVIVGATIPKQTRVIGLRWGF